MLQCSNIVNFITVDINVYNREQGRREKILYTLYLHFIYIPLKMRQKGSNFQYTLAHKQQVSLAHWLHFKQREKKYQPANN